MTEDAALGDGTVDEQSVPEDYAAGEEQTLNQLKDASAPVAEPSEPPPSLPNSTDDATPAADVTMDEPSVHDNDTAGEDKTLNKLKADEALAAGTIDQPSGHDDDAAGEDPTLDHSGFNDGYSDDDDGLLDGAPLLPEQIRKDGDVDNVVTDVDPMVQSPYSKTPPVSSPKPKSPPPKKPPPKKPPAKKPSPKKPPSKKPPPKKPPPRKPPPKKQPPKTPPPKKPPPKKQPPKTPPPKKPPP